MAIIESTSMGVVTLLSAPNLTIGLLERFNYLAKQAQTGEISVEEFIAEATKISPIFSQLIKFFPEASKQFIIPLIVGILGNIIALKLTASDPTPITVNNNITINNTVQMPIPSPLKVFKYSGATKRVKR